MLDTQVCSMKSNQRITRLPVIVMIPVVWTAFGARLLEMHGRNLWFDEAIEFLVSNHPLEQVILADRNLTHDPPLFSLMLNLWMNGGKSDFYVRMLPIFASILAVAVLFALGRRLFSPVIGWMAAVIAAIAPRSVYYGAELNQYAFVLLFAGLLPLLLENYLHCPTLKRLWLWEFVGAAAILTHYELALYLMALAGMGTAYAVVSARTGKSPLLRNWLAGLGMLALVGIGLLWLYALPQKARLPANFAPVRFNSSATLSQELYWIARTVEIVKFVFWGFEPTGLQWITTGWLLVGSVASLLARASRHAVLYLLTSLLTSYIASGFGFLVYSSRYMWNIFPLCALLTCAGIWSLVVGRVRRYTAPICWILFAVMAALLASDLPSISGKPFTETEQLGNIVRYVESHRQPQDAIYVYYGARHAFFVYASEELAHMAVVEPWARQLSALDAQPKMWTVMGGHPRAWILFSHIYPGEDTNLLNALHANCQQLDIVQGISAAGYLFDCSSPPR